MSAERYFNTFDYKKDRSDSSNLYKDEVDQLEEDKQKGIDAITPSEVDIEYTLKYQEIPKRSCSKCKIRKPLTLRYFYKSKRTVDGFSVRCKYCCDEADDKNKAYVSLGSVPAYPPGTKLVWCPGCRTSLPYTLKYFYRSKRSKTGISKKCQSCCNAASSRYDRQVAANKKSAKKRKKRRNRSRKKKIQKDQ